MTIDTAHLYLVPAHEATLRLETFLFQEIRENSAISFFDFMHHSLYHPQYGYYTRGDQNIGRSGDFYTSVSVGKCFGIILAHRIHKLWTEDNSPGSFHLIEIAANNGQLACDILDTIEQTFPALYQCLEYHIIEHLETVKITQLQYLTKHKSKISQHGSPTEISERQGIIISNELIDAFPVHLLEFTNKQWHERLITLDEKKFAFQLSEKLTPEIEAFTRTLPTNLPNGYQTEFRPALSQHIKTTSEMLESFHTITIDYGHSHSSYYAASRSTGTLRCYHDHKADETPLEKPGLKDITAHVDFTQLAKAHLLHNHQINNFSSQAHYLTTHGKDWLLQLEENLTSESFKLIRQFQTLTHPASMGHQFHVLETSSSTTAGKSNHLALEKLEIEHE